MKQHIQCNFIRRGFGEGDVYAALFLSYDGKKTVFSSSLAQILQLNQV